ncbi:MAG: hypothetical protein IJV36_06325 [Prevotella sp.]|nr:hypothetical protein [Prevotella sp.]
MSKSKVHRKPLGTRSATEEPGAEPAGMSMFFPDFHVGRHKTEENILQIEEKVVILHRFLQK